VKRKKMKKIEKFCVLIAAALLVTSVVVVLAQPGPAPYPTPGATPTPGPTPAPGAGGPAPYPTPTPTPSPPKVEYWAVIVGVSEYADPSIPDLHYSDDDANDIYDSLLSYGNWQADHIQKLTDSDATKANIHGAIDWMKTNAKSGDTCLFFFSGHGGWSDDVSPFDEYDGWDEYISPYDSTDWFEDSIRDDELDAWMTPIEAKKIVILDSCLAGGAYRGTDASTKAKPDVPYAKLAKDFAKDLAKDLNKAGYVVLAACEDWGSAWESDILENGVFTYYVVEGLDGPANADADNDISTEEIYEYADPLVIDYTGGWQDPVLYDNVPGELPVVITK